VTASAFVTRVDLEATTAMGLSPQLVAVQASAQTISTTFASSRRAAPIDMQKYA